MSQNVISHHVIQEEAKVNKFGPFFCPFFRPTEDPIGGEHDVPVDGECRLVREAERLQRAKGQGLGGALRVPELPTCPLDPLTKARCAI